MPMTIDKQEPPQRASALEAVERLSGSVGAKPDSSDKALDRHGSGSPTSGC